MGWVDNGMSRWWNEDMMGWVREIEIYSNLKVEDLVDLLTDTNDTILERINMNLGKTNNNVYIKKKNYYNNNNYSNNNNSDNI